MDEFYDHERKPLMPNSRHNIPKGIKDTREYCQQQLAIYLILASTLFERVAFYGLINTLTITNVLPAPFQWNDRDTKTASYIFAGISYILPIIIAIITDAKLGRAKTIIFGFIWYFIGLTLVTVTASGKTFLCDLNDTVLENATKIGNEKCAPGILITLSFTAIGAAAVKSNLAVFGAEQIQKEKTSSRYFDKYSIVVNIGNMIGIALISHIKDNVSVDNYYIPYSISTAMLFLAALLFCISWKFSIQAELYETVATKFIPVVFNALQSWYRFKRDIRSVERRAQSAIPMHLMDISYSLTETEVSLGIHGRPSTFLDFARAANRGKFSDRVVEDVKSLRTALLVFTLLIPFWLIYTQVETTFPSQGKQMSGSQSSDIVYYMSFATIIIGLLIFDLLIYRYIDASHRPFTIAMKLFIGMVFTLLSACVAGIIEIFRQSQCIDPSKPSSLSIYAQLPQYIFIGGSQLFGLVAGYEFAYFAAPRSAQSLFMSLHFCSIGIASFLGAAYINFFPTPNIPIDFECQTDHQWYWSFYTYFFILAGLQFIFMIFFVIFYRKYHIIKVNPQQLARS